ncbi:MAG: type III secretion system export apparatus subunit SctS [Pseudomonadota bacterium]
MEESSGILEFTMQALYLPLVLSMPAIIVASFSGLIVSFFQAITQLQEQTLSFGVKLAAVMFTIILLASWIGGEIFNYATNIFTTFPYCVR